MGAEYVDPDPIVEAKMRAARGLPDEDEEKADRPKDGEVEAAAKKPARKR